MYLIIIIGVIIIRIVVIITGIIWILLENAFCLGFFKIQAYFMLI